MSQSSGSNHLFVETVSWVLFAGFLAYTATHYQQLRQMAGAALGLPKVEQPLIGTAAPDSPPRRIGGGIELKANAYGHYEADIEINGRSVGALVDTGATMVALSFEDAERAGIYPRNSDFTMRFNTANGIARAAPVVLDRISVGDITVRNVQAAVSEPGRLRQTLLGMTFLSRLKRFDMRGGVLTLED